MEKWNCACWEAAGWPSQEQNSLPSSEVWLEMWPTHFKNCKSRQNLCPGNNAQIAWIFMDVGTCIFSFILIFIHVNSFCDIPALFFHLFFFVVFHFILPSFPSMFSPFAFPNRDFPHPVPLLLSHLNLFPPYLLLWSEIIFTALNTTLHFLLPFPHLPVLFLSTFLKYTIIERNWSFPKWYSKTKDAEA